MFTIDASSIDRSLPVPVGKQLYGLLSYVLSFGDMPKGVKLQSVRQLAAELDIAPMTVAEVYKRLRADGLVEIRPGLGAFTVYEPRRRDGVIAPASVLGPDIDNLLEKAEALGISPITLASMVQAQARLRKPRVHLDIVFVGIFEAPARDYVEQIRPTLAANDLISLLTFDHIRDNEGAREKCRNADLVLTFVHREVEMRSLVPDANILSLRFIPSERTRQALALLDPRTRVAAVTQLKDYIAIMRPSVREFAPHISDITVAWSYADDLADIVARCDVVIYASGADHVADLAGPNKRCFEYRHSPDPGVLENLLAPALAELRHNKIADGEARPKVADITSLRTKAR
ncbi:Transcriptional regulator, GntR family (plasmid) [Neorhizobium galegae bv. officinalis bv. officinalis str. HAMBI 1141]|uniref:Transcriptional regulator, GntR family n=1 Tax=Neorhizobium galegae bv. officinalis bv. officinalis str. HAMBI 1141 TaxID=1028801 RepID=A0A068THB7_NEOGA|nr:MULTISPECIES: GntR family transcriptional regulator [Neorhizobium]MCJ9669574.1 GntR family transcriptional regulator [Neorhizobium sp. SHOUNA12B]MCJ9745951.1 GntR family transcriptional regulator [Neorhizobium sp. SHOUNA12A]CDN57509.1 Transcriptional regulator, GntR family [Neorhizobium galegae bv. officinalis bv. officinalis str. HAMBI 1141]